MNLEILSQVIPHLVLIAALSAGIGWALRAKMSPAPKAPEPAPRERSKSADAALEQARASNQSLKADLDALRAESAPKASLESATAELENSRQSLAAEQNRAAALDTDLRKARETIRQLNSKNTDVDKSRNDRAFALENELSKTREQLALLQSRPDDTAVLQAEIERLRESVAVTTRYAGELRKRETAANEALAKLQDRIANSPTPAIAAAPVRSGDSDRVIAAKAEVARLNSLRSSAPERPIPSLPVQPQLAFPADPPTAPSFPTAADPPGVDEPTASPEPSPSGDALEEPEIAATDENPPPPDETASANEKFPTA